MKMKRHEFKKKKKKTQSNIDQAPKPELISQIQTR
jgi:hypothetical protein